MENSSKNPKGGSRRPAARKEDEAPALAKAMSHPTRVRILMAMNAPRRRLSPTKFAKGAKLPVGHCAYHFRRLEEWDCLALVDTKQVRGATEHIYEARSKAMAWTAEWKKFAPHIKHAVLTSVMRGAVEALGSAIDDGSFEARDDSHLSWDTVEVDLEGWQQMAEILDRALAKLLRIEEQSLQRISGGADFFLASYFMTSFEFPRSKREAHEDFTDDLPPAPRLPKPPTKNEDRLKRRALRDELDEQQIMAKAMSHPTRVKILMAMNTPRRRLSPSKFAEETGLTTQHCNYHFGELADSGCIALVATRPRRGATENIYEPRKLALQWTDDWMLLGPVVRQGILASVMQGAVEALGSAIDDGSFEARDDSHLSWNTIKVDERGWSEMCRVFDRTLTELMRVDQETSARIKDGAECFIATYFMASFESPKKVTSLE